MDKVTATESDRLIAMAPEVSRGYTNRTRAKVLRGDKDEDELVQAFARHRLAAQAELEALRAENERLREACWFYYGDDCSSDQCRFSIDECIEEDFESNRPAAGDHVLQISGARPVPVMWVALHYFTEDEKDAREDDEPFTYTVHASEEEARKALDTEGAAS